MKYHLQVGEISDLLGERGSMLYPDNIPGICDMLNLAPDELAQLLPEALHALQTEISAG